MEIIATVAIALFTGLLVWVTNKLAIHTEALSELTRSLVKIEESRDQAENKRKRLNDLSKALEAAQTITKIYPDTFASHLERSDMYPEKDIEAIETLQSFKRYIDNPDAAKCLDDLCNDFDNVRTAKRNYKGNRETTTLNIKEIQTKILSSVKKWRDEISRAG